MDCSIPGFPVLHYLPEFAQTHVHWVDDAIQPCHPLSYPLLPSIFLSIWSFSVNWLFASSNQSIGASASVLPVNIQEWFPLRLTGLVSLQSKGLSRVFSNTIQKHQFLGAQPSLWSNSHPYATTRKTILLTRWTFVGKVMSLPGAHQTSAQCWNPHSPCNYAPPPPQGQQALHTVGAWSE